MKHSDHIPISGCSYDPSPLVNVPLGMFHCPDCGEMVVAGLPHPDYSLLDDPDFGPEPLDKEPKQ